jgi:mannosyl-oligosaccharide alpha-1,2-mannosidase
MYRRGERQMFVEKCQELVDKLQPAFQTPTGIPYNIINLRSGTAKNPAWTQQVCTNRAWWWWWWPGWYM